MLFKNSKNPSSLKMMGYSLIQFRVFQVPIHHIFSKQLGIQEFSIY